MINRVKLSEERMMKLLAMIQRREKKWDIVRGRAVEAREPFVRETSQRSQKGVVDVLLLPE